MQSYFMINNVIQHALSTFYILSIALKESKRLHHYPIHVDFFAVIVLRLIILLCFGRKVCFVKISSIYQILEVSDWHAFFLRFAFLS